MREFQIFYRDYERDIAVKSTEAEWVDSEALQRMAWLILVKPDNFFGITDSGGAILQLAVADADYLLVELIYPDSTAALRKRMSRSEAEVLLKQLPDPFDESLLPGAAYIA